MVFSNLLEIPFERFLTPVSFLFIIVGLIDGHSHTMNFTQDHFVCMWGSVPDLPVCWGAAVICFSFYSHLYNLHSVLFCYMKCRIYGRCNNFILAQVGSLYSTRSCTVEDPEMLIFLHNSVTSSWLWACSIRPGKELVIYKWIAIHTAVIYTIYNF